MSRGWREWSLLCLAFLAPAAFRMPAADGTGTAADEWWTGEFASPRGAAPAPAAGVFDGVSGVARDGRLRVRWSPPASVTGIEVLASTDSPGHWRVRDWRRYPMAPEGAGSWQASIPVPSVEVPTFYLVRATLAGKPTDSPPRIFRPRLAGLTQPTFPFTGFLEGFEEGVDAWELIGRASVPGSLGWSNHAASGRHALRVVVPSGRGSVTIGTVRVRGWMLVEHPVVALRWMARTESGEGRVRCALHSRARTPDLAVHESREEWVVGPGWRQVEVPLVGLPHLRPADVDWLTLQFRAEAGGVLLVDDLELVLR